MGLFKDFYLRERTEGKVYDFSSSQIDCPMDLSQRIYDWGLQNISDDKLGEDGRQELGTQHITTLYGLHTAYSDDILPLVQCFNPFIVRLGKISLFNLPEQDVVKVEILADQLYIINKFFKNSLNHTETHPNYQPHLTLAYVKKGTCDHLVGNSDLEGLEFMVEGISFSSKLGEKTFIPFEIKTYSPPIGKFDVRFRS